MWLARAERKMFKNKLVKEKLVERIESFKNYDMNLKFVQFWLLVGIN